MKHEHDNDTIDWVDAVTNTIGYARVSTQEQNLETQKKALEAAGCHRIFTDVASGAKDDRPGLAEAMNYLRKGDTLVVWKIDRLGRSLSHLVHLIDELGKRGVAFKSLTDGDIDTTTPMGRMWYGMAAIMADYERSLIRERTKAALATVKKRGISTGRKPVIDSAKLEKARKLMDKESGKGLSVRQAAAVLKVGKTALYKALAAEGGTGKEG
ncbi:recombinase family protein [Rhizobium sp. LCM 4573]|uniref:recombinase family protein n=1 Tax=Rhizobium sp. LCM 4573 TaxID=1848291 RepID=UPI0008D8F6E3|nr:recombinase family protein [Rhizobium sp. LCM 4573]OHV78530.1 invertase [Rhizobium sp. LCM 4573]